MFGGDGETCSRIQFHFEGWATPVIEEATTTFSMRSRCSTNLRRCTLRKTGRGITASRSKVLVFHYVISTPSMMTRPLLLGGKWNV